MQIEEQISDPFSKLGILTMFGFIFSVAGFVVAIGTAGSLLPFQKKFHIMLSVFGMGSFGVLFFLHQVIKQRIYLAGLTLVLMFYFAEAVIAIFPGGFQFDPHRMGQDHEILSQIEVIDDLNSNGIAAYLPIGPDHFLNLSPEDVEAFPLANLPEGRIVFCRSAERWIVLNTDRYGFNNPPEAYRTNRPTAALIGDERVQGACVANDADLGRILRKLGHSAVNLGMSHTGPLTQLAILNEYAHPLEPDHVFWFFDEGSDLADLERESDSELLRSYLDYDFTQRLIFAPKELEKLIRKASTAEIQRRKTEAMVSPREAFDRKFRAFIRFVHLRGTISSLIDKYRTPTPVPDLFAEIFRMARVRVNNWGGTLHVVYLPARARFHAGTPFSREKVLKILDSMNIPVIDMTPILEEMDKPLDAFSPSPGGSFIEAGYQSAAEAIHRKLREK